MNHDFFAPYPKGLPLCEAVSFRAGRAKRLALDALSVPIPIRGPGRYKSFRAAPLQEKLN